MRVLSPTTGLHGADVQRLLDILQRLADGGSTVVVIEHNLDVIKCADYIIDMGPEGGAGGGTVIAKGTPEEVAKVKESYTGQYLAPHTPQGRRKDTAKITIPAAILQNTAQLLCLKNNNYECIISLVKFMFPKMEVHNRWSFVGLRKRA